MKNLLLPILVCTLVFTAITSCKKTVKAVLQEISTPLPELQYVLDTIPSSLPIPVGTPIPLPRVTQPFNLDSIVKANTGNNFSAADIKSVKVKQLDLKILEGADASNNLSNFQSASFQFSSNTNTTPVQVSDIIFDDVYATEKIISGDGSPELRSYLDGNQLYYDIIAKIRRKPTKKNEDFTGCYYYYEIKKAQLFNKNIPVVHERDNCKYHYLLFCIFYK